MFRANDDDKKQLCHLLLRVWSAQEAALRFERTEMAVLIVGEKVSPSTRLIKWRIELKVRIVIIIIIIITQISNYSYRLDRLHSFYYYLSFQTPVALYVSCRGA